MTEHYSGHDPATGCALMMIFGGIGGTIIWGLAVVGVLHLLGVLR